MPNLDTAFDGAGSGVAGAIGGIGGAVSSFFNAEGSAATAAGDTQAAQLYGQAATLAQQNAGYALTNEDVALMQQRRTFGQATGTEEADAGANGVSVMSPSVQAALRETGQQNQLQNELVGIQGNININGYNEQAVGLLAQQDQANAAASAAEASETGGIFSGLFGIAKAAVSLF